jgi:sensor domain CHASE-containing protein
MNLTNEKNDRRCIMRTALIIILLFAIVLPCFAELTDNDIMRIRQLIREELEPIKIEIATIKGDMKALEGKMATKDDLLAVWKDMTGKFDALRQETGDKIDTLYGVTIGVLTAIIVAILSILLLPVIQRWLERRKQVSDKERFQKIETELETLKAIMETEKKRRETARRIAEEKPEFAEAYKAVGLLN